GGRSKQRPYRCRSCRGAACCARLGVEPLNGEHLSPAEQKQAARVRAWAALVEASAARFPRPIHGRIPNFAGSEIAARALLSTPEFQRARVVKVNPDAPQRYLR